MDIKKNWKKLLLVDTLVLFLGLTFLSLWLFEVLVGVRVHAVQYLMVGAAMSLFYLLLLAFSEHIGFGTAYGLASGGVIGLIAGGPRRA